MVLTNSKSTERELNVIRQIISIQLEVSRKFLSFLEMKPLSSNLETIALLEQSERDILVSQILGLSGFLQQAKNRQDFSMILCSNLQKEQRRPYIKDSISMLMQVLKKISKLKRQSLRQNT